VIAEFAQPNLKVLRQHDDASIRNEVERVAKNDLLLQLAFSHAMGAPNIEIIPLHEDPATMQHAASIQGMIRDKLWKNKSPLLDQMLGWMQIDKNKPSSADQQALRYIDADGRPQKMTAYQYMQQLGFSDTELGSRGLVKKTLQDSYVLEG